MEKAEIRNIALDRLEEDIQDIAGIRIMCQFVEDIHEVVRLLRSRKDFEIIIERDYITNKKASGYRSYHLVIEYPVQRIEGEKIVICGPSGSGKSTMIRCINRLEEHQKGDIIVKGTPLTHDIKNIESVRRDVGMVFQHFNLFPHLTVLENCCLAPIWVKKIPRAEAEATAMKYLQRVKIPEQA